MVWGVIRIAIFFGAFVIGLIIVEQLMPSVASNSLRKHSGTSLLVVCESVSEAFTSTATGRDRRDRQVWFPPGWDRIGFPRTA